MVELATSFRLPFAGGLTLTQDFGVENTDIVPGLHHLGEDWAGAWGTPVLAAANGLVVDANPTGPLHSTFGRHVIVEHQRAGAAPVHSLYAHLDTVSVAVGDEVAIGQQIGGLGDSGAATGLHLHWEISLDNNFLLSQKSFADNRTVDPSDFVTANAGPVGPTGGFAGLVINGVDAGDYSGNSVSGAGDINGDGIDDLIIGARFADPNGSLSGESYVVFGT